MEGRDTGMIVACAWCKKTVGQPPDDGSVTHVICRECLEHELHSAVADQWLKNLPSYETKEPT